MPSRYAASGSDLYDLVLNWQQFGFYDIILPFLLVFTLAFAVLQKVKIFGEKARNINAVVALILAFLFLQNTYLIFLLQRFLPNISFVMIVVLMLLLLFGIFGGAHSSWTGAALNVAFLFSVIITLVALSTDFIPGGYGGTGLTWWEAIDPGLQSLIIMGIIVVAVLVGVMRSGEPRQEQEGGFLHRDYGIGGRKP